MARLEQITKTGYEVEIIWECEFDYGILEHHPERQTHPLMEQSPLNTRDALNCGRTEAMTLHYRIRDGETIEYLDVMILYPFICKYFKFPVEHPTIHSGDVCKDMDAMLMKEDLIKCTILPPRRL
jgi:hypothetical protein